MTRIILSLPPELLERVTDWQHHYRLPSRAEAIRSMLAIAIMLDDPKRVPGGSHVTEAE